MHWFYHYILTDQLAKNDHLDILEVNGTESRETTVNNNCARYLFYKDKQGNQQSWTAREG